MGRILKIAGKNMIETAENNINSYANTITNTAGKQIKQTGNQEGISYGNEYFEPVTGIIVISDYWTNTQNKKISSAKLGNTVRIHVAISNIPDQTATFNLYEHNVIMKNTLLLHNQSIEIKEGKGCKDIYLNPDWKKYFGQLEGYELELICTFQYKKHTNRFIIYKEKKYKPQQLIVESPDKVEGELVFLRASEEHELPQMYDAKTGMPYYIKVIKKNAAYVSKLNSLYKTMQGAQKLSILENQAYNLAIRRLKKGELVFSDGSISSTKRLYERTLYDVDKKFEKTVQIGVNKGNFKSGVTSKPINQLEAMVVKDTQANWVMKTAKVAKVAGTLFNIAGMLADVGNKKMVTNSFMPPFVTMEVDKRLEEIYEDMHNAFLKELEKAKQTGNMFTVAGVVNKYVRNQDILRGYEFIFLSQKTLEKILKKEIIKRNKIGIEYLEIKNAECGILVQGLEVKDLYDRTIYTYYIHAIYLPENFIEG